VQNLKPLSKKSIPAALDKALRYRLLNEPVEAESICQDVLLADPLNEQALTTMVLALTDLFESEYVAAFQRAKALLPRLASDYDRAYYEGIIYERWAKAELARQVPGHVATGWFLEALRSFERAEALAPPDNPDAILRWNTCARLVARYEQGESAGESMSRHMEVEFSDETPTA
jgi:hypothetical protein